MANETLTLTVITPERRLLAKVQTDAVNLPGSEGQIQILPGHAPMIGTLETGAFHFKYKDESGHGSSGFKEESGVISSGFFEVKEGEVIVMAETLELKKEIDLTRARAAQSKAEATLQQADLNEHQFKKYQLKLQRSLIRQHVGGSN